MANSSLLLGWRRRWNRSLFRFLGRRVRAAVDIEDLAQETYLRLLRARDLSEVRNPQAYLIKVANHVVYEWRHQQLPPAAIEVVDDQQFVDESCPELEVEASLSQARLERTLAGLSPVMRAVVLLKLRDERSCEQIS